MRKLKSLLTRASPMVIDSFGDLSLKGVCVGTKAILHSKWSLYFWLLLLAMQSYFFTNDLADGFTLEALSGPLLPLFFILQHEKIMSKLNVTLVTILCWLITAILAYNLVIKLSNLT
ncbi:hypothetical protein ACOV11_07015 [Vibrio natriegens]|jgi:hypothetical protein|uniref:hypothetical protein n=1 Tax=Vibrio natriegens TaxID=691 RepID=UPI002E3006C9|nr:hypothetical protein [Vibrio natriegens]